MTSHRAPRRGARDPLQRRTSSTLAVPPSPGAAPCPGGFANSRSREPVECLRCAVDVGAACRADIRRGMAQILGPPLVAARADVIHTIALCPSRPCWLR
jgi:hypothetical protein